MSLLDARHQDHALRAIQRAVAGERVPHAYLFHGPDGVGKELVAVGLAELLLCANPIMTNAADNSSEKLRAGCGVCADCKLVAAQTHPDLHIIHRYLIREHPDADVRRRKGLDIGIDVIRHFVIDKMGYAPARGRAKVFIVREADRITTAAQNALLKTLEEPPGPAFIILLASNADRLLATTKSRCQPVRFDALPAAFIQERLDQAFADRPANVRTWAARACDGSLGRAITAIEDDLFPVNERIVSALPAALLRGDEGESVKLAELITNEAKELVKPFRSRDPDISDTEATRRALTAMLAMIADWLADLLRLTTGREDHAVNQHALASLRKINSPDVEALLHAIPRIARAERQLELNANTQLVLDVLFADLRNVLARTDGRAVGTHSGAR